MFGDGEYTGHPEQEKNFHSFAREPVDLVILVGSSGAVPTNDYLALEFMRQGAPAININLDPSANSIVGTEYLLPLKGKQAFEKLDAALQAL
jgi:NAD-dependent SIR2 family protein deacetylase